MRKKLFSVDLALLSMLCTASFSVGMSLAQATSAECPANVPRVYVDAEGQITLNGNSLNSRELYDVLSTMSPRPTRACYAHGLLVGNPVPGGLAAMRTLVALELEVLDYTDATFQTPL